MYTKVIAQEFTWATQVYSPQLEIGIDTDIDSQGNKFVLGYGTGPSITLDGITYNCNGTGGDVFMAKYDENNSLLWFKLIGADEYNYSDKALDIHVDIDDNVYIIVESAGDNFMYDGTIISGINTSGQYSGEGVILKVDNDGNYLWHDEASQTCYFTSVVTDTSGHVYMTGYFSNALSFGDSITLTNTTSGSTRDMFIAKYDSTGQILWANNAGGIIHNSYAYGLNVAFDDSTNTVVVLGRFSKNIIFDEDTLAPPLELAAFMVAYNDSGTQLWVNSIFNTSFPYCKGLDISNNGIIGVGGYDHVNDRGLLGFYDLNGNVQSEEFYDSTTQCEIYSLEFNEYEECYLSGMFLDSITLGNTMYDTTLYANLSDYNNGLIIKLDSAHQLIWANQTSSSFHNNLTYKNERILYSGQFMYSFVYNYAIDSFYNSPSIGYKQAVFAELSEPFCPASLTIDTHEICDDLEWIDGNTYTSSNQIARYIVPNNQGCDSIIQLKYTKLEPTYGIDEQTSCYKILWLDGEIYTESNSTATHILTNANGCDSIVTLHLTIGVENIGTTVIDSTLTANMSGVSYQWLNCNENFSAIFGEISQTYSPQFNGSYAVEIIQNGCVDTSACQSIEIISTPINNLNRIIEAYPNPFSDIIILDVKDANIEVVEVINELGKIIYTKNINVGKTPIHLDISSGIYVLRFISKDKIEYIKVIKE